MMLNDYLEFKPNVVKVWQISDRNWIRFKNVKNVFEDIDASGKRTLTIVQRDNGLARFNLNNIDGYQVYLIDEGEE